MVEPASHRISEFPQPYLCGQCDLQMHREAGTRGECHQGIETELADAAAQQIVEARLRYPETPCGLGLGYSPPQHGRADRDHQARTEPHVFRLGRSIFQRIPDALKHLNAHRILALCSRGRDAAKSTSRFAVCRVFLWNAWST